MNHLWPSVVRWIAAHETITYAVVSSVALALLRTRTPEAWLALGERFPRLQGVIRVLRGLGVDPVKVLRGVAQLLEGKALRRAAEDGAPNEVSARDGDAAPQPQPTHDDGEAR